MSIDSYLGLSKPDEKKEVTVKSALADIVFEPRSVYEGKHKKLYTFDASLRALRKRGYERHPRPAEAFDLICRGLEGRLSLEQQTIADDMMNDYGEWLSMAMLRKGNLLHCYLDPENLIWNQHRFGYDVQEGKLKHAGEEVYSIGSVNGLVSVEDVNEINHALVEKLWSRHYVILPKEVRQNARLWFLPEKFLWPVSCFGYFRSLYFIGTNDKFWASRGVRNA